MADTRVQRRIMTAGRTGGTRFDVRRTHCRAVMARNSGRSPLPRIVLQRRQAGGWR